MAHLDSVLFLVRLLSSVVRARLDSSIQGPTSGGSSISTTTILTSSSHLLFFVAIPPRIFPSISFPSSPSSSFKKWCCRSDLCIRGETLSSDKWFALLNLNHAITKMCYARHKVFIILTWVSRSLWDFWMVWKVCMQCRWRGSSGSLVLHKVFVWLFVSHRAKKILGTCVICGSDDISTGEEVCDLEWLFVFWQWVHHTS